MDVIELVREVASSPADEIEIASLPDWAWAVPNFGQSETRLGFQVAHDFWQRYGFWVKKQVRVVGHDDIAIKGEIRLVLVVLALRRSQTRISWPRREQY